MRFLLLFIITLCYTSAQAQDAIVFNGGASMVNRVTRNIGTGTTSSGSAVRASYHAGIYNQTNLSDFLNWKIGLLYSNKGQRSGNPGQGNGSNTHMHYACVPLVFSYQVLENLDLCLGAEAGFLIGAKTKFNLSNSLNPVNNDIYSAKTTDSFKRLDAGVLMAVQYQIGDALQFEMRYTMGLVNTSEITFTNPTVTTTTSVRNRATMISINYLLE